MVMKPLLGRLLLGLLGRLPLRVHRWIAIALTPLLAVLARRKQVMARANIAKAFPDLDPAACRHLARANLRELVQTALECGPLWHREPAWIESRIVAVEGESHIEAALADGRGVLLLGGHLGNWELAILSGSLRMPLDFLYKPPGSERLDEMLSVRRSRFGARMVPTGGAAMRRILRTLRGGGAAGLLFDQLPKGGDFVRAPFFGHPVATMTLPHRLIQATGCAVVMGHCIRSEQGTGWTVRFAPVPGAEDPDPQLAAAAMNRALEAEIRRAPAQYLWHYRRFQQLDD